MVGIRRTGVGKGGRRVFDAAIAPRIKQLYAIPLLYKVLFANSFVILMGATLGTSLATRLQGNSRPLVLVGFVVTGLPVSVVINFALLKLAL